MCPTHADPAAPTGTNVWTIVVAGGSGTRFGTRKQFVELAGKTVLQRSVDSATSVSDGVVVVVPEDAVGNTPLTNELTENFVVVAGGASRAESVRAGLAAVPDEAAVILVHDAARPLATTALFSAVIDAVHDGAHAVVPAIEVADTIRHVDGAVLDRSDLRAVQTPQGFTASALRAAHLGAAEATDDASLVERAGGDVRLVAGEAANRKITDPVDLLMAEAVIRRSAT